MTNNDMNIQYNFKDLKIYTIDGVFAQFDEAEGRLLFFNNDPIMLSKKQSNQLKTNCLVELRMKPDTFRKIALEITETLIAKDPDFIKWQKQEKHLNTPEEMYV